MQQMEPVAMQKSACGRCKQSPSANETTSHLVSVKIQEEELGAQEYRLVKVYRCKECGTYWKVRLTRELGKETKEVWVRAGESNAQLAFTADEAEGFRKAAEAEGKYGKKRKDGGLGAKA